MTDPTSEILRQEHHLTGRSAEIFADPKIMGQAYSLFLESDRDLFDIAIELNLPREVLATWVKRGGWIDRKKQITNDYLRAAEDKYRQYLIQQRLPALMRHQKIGQGLEGMILDVIEKAIAEGKTLDPTAIRRLAEAFSSSANVTAKVAELAKKEDKEAEARAAGKREAKQPLIVIGGGPVNVTVTENASEEQVRDAIDTVAEELK